MNEAAYVDPVTRITDLDPYFKYDPKKRTYTFIGESLEVRIPKRFEVYGVLDITDSVTTLGIVDLIIDGKYEASLVILAEINIQPSDMSEMVFDGTPYLVLYLQKGDIFISNTQVPRNPGVIYATYVEFITRGKPIYTLDYDALALIFDRVKETTGESLGVDRVLYELIISHLARDADDLFQQYRHTDMKSPMQLIPLRSVTFAPTNTTTRIVGSYKDDGTVAALQTETKTDQPFENIFRGIPQDL